MFHRVAHEAAEIGGSERSVEAVGGALHDDVSSVVGNREVPPVVSRALDARVDPFHGFASEVAAHHVAGPEHFDRWVQSFAVNGEAAVFGGVSPEARIVGGANG